MLDNHITCDGFYHSAEVRVQSHIHTDHMSDFSSSLGQEVLMTRATGRLLAEQYPALDSRANVHMMEPGNAKVVNGYTITLLPAGHMLGSAQVKVGLSDGLRLGYSGDFGWPLDAVIEVDVLVLDATYGNPESVRRYTQDDAQMALVELVAGSLRHGPVHLQGTTGPLERALSLLEMADVIGDLPIIVPKKGLHSIDVHREFGITMPNRVLIADSDEARDAIDFGCYIRLWGLQGGPLNDGLYRGTAIRVTKFLARNEVVQQLSDRAYCVGISNHADFEGTLEYVRRTGAQSILIDCMRAQKNLNSATRAAEVIRGELGLRCVLSQSEESRSWGE